MAKKKPDVTAWTKPSQFRFTADELAMIDRLQETLGLRSRIDALRVALSEACRSRRLAGDAPADQVEAQPAEEPTPKKGKRKRGG